MSVLVLGQKVFFKFKNRWLFYNFNIKKFSFNRNRILNIGVKCKMYFSTIVMGICIEMTITSMYSYYSFFVYQFHIEIKKVFTQGFNSIFEFINIIYAFRSFALIFGLFFDCYYFYTPLRILWKEVWVILSFFNYM